MHFGRLDRALAAALAASWLLAGPAAAARRTPPPPALELPATAPLIDVEIAGQAVRLTVDIGGDDIVQINPGTPVAAVLAGATRSNGEPVDRGLYRVAVGQQFLAIPFSREPLVIGGRILQADVLTPPAPPAGQPPGSDGTIGMPLLPHAGVTLRWRAAKPGDRRVELPARLGRSNGFGFNWPLAGGNRLDVELHPLRPASVASAAAASLLATAGSGRLDGPVRRITIDFGVVRPVRRLLLAVPVAIAGLPLRSAEVRLFDWAGKADLPPDADPDTAAMTVLGRRGRQRGWPVLKLGSDMLSACASIVWQREPARWQLTCPNS